MQKFPAHGTKSFRRNPVTGHVRRMKVSTSYIIIGTILMICALIKKKCEGEIAVGVLTD
jgi:hypothetical protein